MEIYQLRYFVAVAEAGNFTKAAVRQNISQPSLSQQIINLEEEIGRKLFHRLGRKVTLTDAGQTLLGHARRILTEADNVIRDLKDEEAKGYRVTVGVAITLAHFILPAVIAHCRMNDIRLRMRSHEDFSANIAQSLIAGELDIGVLSMQTSDPRLVSIPLFTEPLLLAVGSNHRLATVEQVRVSDLSDENFILQGHLSSLTALIRRISGNHDFEPRVAHYCTQLSTLKTMTALGLGISILPRTAGTANDPAGLVYRKFASPAPTREVHIVHHYRRHLNRGAQLFIEAARAVVGPTPSASSAPFAR